MNIKIYESVPYDDKLYDQCLATYRGSFKGLETLAAQRHMMYGAEFEFLMNDITTLKFVVFDDHDNVIGLAAYTNNLYSVDLISVEFYRSRWPEHVEQLRLWYCLFVAVHPDYPGAFLKLCRAMYDKAAETKSIIALDFCDHNDQELGMGRSITKMLTHFDPSTKAQMVDVQEYWVYEFGE
jgi:hypothetical protein